MPTIKKPSKARVSQKANNDIQIALTAIENGAKAVLVESYNKTEYGILYPEGGYFTITKTIFNQINK